MCIRDRAEDIEITFDEAAAQLLASLDLFPLFVIRNGFLGIFNAPEARMLRDSTRGEQANYRRFERCV